MTLSSLLGNESIKAAFYPFSRLSWNSHLLRGLLSFSAAVSGLRPHGLQGTRSLYLTVRWSLLKRMSTESVTLSNHLILCRPLLLPSVFPSIRVFSSKSAVHINWPKYWSFSFSISRPSEYSGLISLKTDWCDLLAIQGLRDSQESSSAPQFESIKSFGSQPSLWSNSHIHSWLLEKR